MYHASLKGIRGNALLTVLLTSLVAGVALTVVLQQGSRLYKAESSTRAKAAEGATNAFNLVLASERFHIDGKKLPIWYPVPYPTAKEMADKIAPTIEVIQAADDDEISFVPKQISTGRPDRPISKLKVDKSKMGSVQDTNELTKKTTSTVSEEQFAFISSGNLNQLSPELLSDFFVRPNSSWPGTNDNSLQGLTKSQLTFLNYVADTTYPNWAKELLVSISTTSTASPQPITTMAKFAIDAPPSPTCKLELADGPQKQPILPGSNVKFILSADSVATLGRIEYVEDSFRDVAVTTPQSIRNLGTFNKIHDSESISVPTTLPAKSFTSGPFKGSSIWHVSARVYGIKNDGTEIPCSLDVAVGTVPDPVCTLTASPSNVRAGQSTTLTLSCQNPVATATINSVPVTFNAETGTASLIYTKRNASQKETLTALAIGPSGGKSNPSTIVGPGTCRFNDPNYVEMANFAFGNIEMTGGVYRTFYRSPDFTTVGNGGRLGRVTSVQHFERSAGNAGPLYDGHACASNSVCMMGWNVRYSFNTFSSTYYSYTGAHPEGRYWVQYGPADQETCSLQNVWTRNNGCFIAGTKILMADGRQMLIDQIRENDWVRNPVNRKMLRVRKVTVGPEYKPLFQVKVGKESIRVTEDHPFFTKSGIKRADHLTTSDQVKTALGWKKISQVMKEAKNPEASVWNIELDSNDEADHMVLANGIPTGDLWIQLKGIKKGQHGSALP